MQESKANKSSARAPLWVGLIALVVLGVLFAVGYMPRHKRERAVQAAARQEVETVPQVNAAPVKRSPGESQLLLPGNLAPLTEAVIYSRASGYLRKRLVDIGDHVRAGQLLAEIEAPELDQQVAQARSALAQAERELAQRKANLAQAEAQLQLARVTWDRYKPLVARGTLSRQEGDQAEAGFHSAQATVEAQQASIHAAQENIAASRANLERLVSLQGYEKVIAPFAGVVTARQVDVGSLISPGAAGELFRLAQNGTMRIFINVPQEDAPGMRPGLEAQVLLREFPQRIFRGRVTRTANAVDPSMRTLLTEVQVANTDGTLLPGMYAQVRFISKRANPPLLIPGDSIITRPEGAFVAVLLPGGGANSRVHLQKVEMGQDHGMETEVLSGLEGGERVITSPGDFVQEGVLVHPVSGGRKQ